MTDYYVDSAGDDLAAGGSGTPWATLRRAKLTATSGSDTVYLTSGSIASPHHERVDWDVASTLDGQNYVMTDSDLVVPDNYNEMFEYHVSGETAVATLNSEAWVTNDGMSDTGSDIPYGTNGYQGTTDSNSIRLDLMLPAFSVFQVEVTYQRTASANASDHLRVKSRENSGGKWFDFTLTDGVYTGYDVAQDASFQTVDTASEPSAGSAGVWRSEDMIRGDALSRTYMYIGGNNQVVIKDIKIYQKIVWGLHDAGSNTYSTPLGSELSTYQGQELSRRGQAALLGDTLLSGYGTVGDKETDLTTLVSSGGDWAWLQEYGAGDENTDLHLYVKFPTGETPSSHTFRLSRASSLACIEMSAAGDVNNIKVTNAEKAFLISSGSTADWYNCEAIDAYSIGFLIAAEVAPVLCKASGDPNTKSDAFLIQYAPSGTTTINYYRCFVPYAGDECYDLENLSASNQLNMKLYDCVGMNGAGVVAENGACVQVKESAGGNSDVELYGGVYYKDSTRQNTVVDINLSTPTGAHDIRCYNTHIIQEGTAQAIRLNEVTTISVNATVVGGSGTNALVSASGDDTATFLNANGCLQDATRTLATSYGGLHPDAIEALGLGGSEGVFRSPFRSV